MKLEVGKIAIENDDLVVELQNGKNEKIPVNTVSLGGKEYSIGEQVEGIIIDGKYNIVRHYDSESLSVYGFISQDRLDNDYIHVTIIYNESGTIKVGEELPIKRDFITNY